MDASKRNSIAAKVATPKVGGSAGGSGTASPTTPQSDPIETLKKVIGARIKLVTAAPHAQTLEGILFTACPVLNIVALNVRSPLTASNPAAQPGDYHMIPVARIQHFQVVSLPSPEQNKDGGSGGLGGLQPPIGPVDMKRLKAREEARIEKLKDEERNRGKGVTQEAQAIYDSFKRINMPIRWHNQEMIVHEAVIIAPPYRVEDCKGARDKQEVLNRVKKVLDGERRKLREKADKDERAAAAASPSTGQRKGG